MAPSVALVTFAPVHCLRDMASARRTTRHRRRFRVTVGTTPVFTTDIGPGGFSVEAMRVQPPGTQVNGSIRVGEREVGYAGEIAWAREGAPHMALRGRMGVRFTRISTELVVVLGAMLTTVG